MNCNPTSNNDKSSQTNIEWAKQTLSKRPQNEILFQIYKGTLLGGVTTMLLTPLLYSIDMMMLNQVPILKHCCRGMGCNGANVIPATTIQITVNSLMQRLFFPNKQLEELSMLEKLFCSATAGGVSGIATAPGSMAVINYQKQTKVEHTVRQILVNTYQVGGIQRCFSGGLALGLREMFWTTAYLTFSPAFGNLLRSLKIEEYKAKILGAALSGAVGGFLTNPANYLKAQKQKEAMNAQPPRSYIKIIQEEGAWKLFSGSPQRATLVAIACVVFTEGNRLLDKLYNQ